MMDEKLMKEKLQEVISYFDNKIEKKEAYKRIGQDPDCKHKNTIDMCYGDNVDGTKYGVLMCKDCCLTVDSYGFGKKQMRELNENKK